VISKRKSYKKQLKIYSTELKENLQEYIARECSEREIQKEEFVNLKKEIQEFNINKKIVIDEKLKRLKTCKDLKIEYFPKNYNFDMFYKLV
jgi:hypothetical protein